MRSLTILLMFTGVLTQSVTSATQCCPENVLVLRNGTCRGPGKVRTEVGLKCQTGYIPLYEDVNAPWNHFNVDEKDTLSFVDRDTNEKFENGSYCIGRARISKTDYVRAVIICAYKVNSFAHVHVPCMYISLVFSVLTAIIYVSLPELRDLQGKSIVNLCISQGAAMLMAIILHMEYNKNTNAEEIICASKGFLFYFFLVTSFFWMNAITIQTLLMVCRPAIVSKRGWKEFLYFALYAWGLPLLLTVILIIINYITDKNTGPRIGKNTCFFFDTTQKWYYLYSVMSALLLANLLIFGYMATVLWRHQFRSSTVQAVKYKFCMTIKLFCVTGLTWFAELISAGQESYIIWVIMDVINLLLGFFLFLVLVVFRYKVVKAMHAKGWLVCCPLMDRLLAKYDVAENGAEHTTVAVSMNEK